jgi:hypothetical protein
MNLFAALTTAAIGAVLGIAWGFALDVPVGTAVVVGVIAGIVVSLLLGLVARRAVGDPQGRLQAGEAMAANGAILGGLAALTLGLAVLAWIIRSVL